MNELIGEIVSKVGVNQEQAEGGLGAILNFAKDQLDRDTFSKIASNIGGTDDLIGKFANLASGSNAGGIGGLLSSATSALGIKTDIGGLASMVGTLSNLNIDLDTLKKFAPVVSGFLKNKGLGDIADKIDSLL